MKLTLFGDSERPVNPDTANQLSAALQATDTLALLVLQLPHYDTQVRRSQRPMPSVI